MSNQLSILINIIIKSIIKSIVYLLFQYDTSISFMILIWYDTLDMVHIPNCVQHWFHTQPIGHIGMSGIRDNGLSDMCPPGQGEYTLLLVVAWLCTCYRVSALREESSQTNVILQYKLLAAILSAVCIVMHVPFISIGWKVVDKSLGAGLKLFIVNISLENVLHTCHYKENKNIHTYIHNLIWCYYS